MALSNWDTLAVNEAGESINGVFKSPLGVVVEIYKNWIYVRDEAAWQDGGSFIKPTVMQVEHGAIRYKDVSITARRGPQQGVFCVVETRIYPKNLEKDCTKCKAKKGHCHNKDCPDFVETKYFVMIGCGVYGFDDSEWVGVTQESMKFLLGWIHGSEKELMEIPMQIFKPGTTNEQILEHYKKQGDIVVIEKDGRLYHEYEQHDFEEHVRKIDLAKAVRFNQGDQFFANKLGTDLPATPPGESEPPILTKVLEET